MIRSIEDALLKYANLAERCEQGREKDARERGEMMIAIADLARGMGTLQLELRDHIAQEERILPGLAPSAGRRRLESVSDLEPDEKTLNGTEYYRLTKSDIEALRVTAKVSRFGGRVFEKVLIGVLVLAIGAAGAAIGASVKARSTVAQPLK